eukprot:COSAG06_NODE_1296_length_9960_cov_2.570009_2_plen_87_part_00
MCERDLVHHTSECIGLEFFCAVRNAKQATGTQCNNLSHVVPYWYHLPVIDRVTQESSLLRTDHDLPVYRRRGARAGRKYASGTRTA